MSYITLEKIYKIKNTINYEYSYSSDLREYFNDINFKIEYPENIESVPDGIAAIPFVANVLPMIWLTHSTLKVKDLDKSFFNCIDKVNNSYSIMFPNINLSGDIIVENVVDCSFPQTEKCAMLFSGGVDSLNTLINHIDEKPDLISIWGSDMRYDNYDGWNKVHNIIADTARKFSLNEVVFHSNFREFDNEGILDKNFGKILQDGYWHGLKHSLALLGHVAPYVYIHEISTIYIASTYSWKSGQIRIASHAITDNYIRFGSCRVFHDGFEYERTDKIANIVDYSNKNNIQFPIHVCWKSQSGENCSNCEKCFRTMMGIWVEGADPNDYGFNTTNTNLSKIKQIIDLEGSYFALPLNIPFWIEIKDRAEKNIDLLKQKPYYNDLSWIFDIKALLTKETNQKVSIINKIKGKFAKYDFYQKLHELKTAKKRGK